MNAVIYARFSPRPNAKECLSVEIQLERCRAYCAASAMSIVGEFFDKDASGARADNRPGLQRALAAAAAGKCVLVIYKLDRLSRSTRDAIKIFEDLRDAGADLASICEKIDTTSPAGKFFFTLSAALAEMQREQIAERTQERMLWRQSQGQLMSKIPPFGFKAVDKMLVLEAGEQEAIDIILKQHKKGKSLRSIGKVLTEKGFTCRGGKWHPKTIHVIIKRGDNAAAKALMAGRA